MKTRFLSISLILLPVLAFAQTYKVREVRINYDPVLTVSHVPTDRSAIATLVPEFVFAFIPEQESESESIGSIEVTLYLHGTIDLLKTTYPRQAEHAMQIFEEQAMDAAILLRNKFGGQLSRTTGAEFDEPEAFLVEMLDAWNHHWEKSRTMWEPYLAALRTEHFPIFEKHYVRSFRYHYFGEAIPVSS